jgi:murein DD-endopeptidase MepM/ murein hydrolase activator NlpD
MWWWLWVTCAGSTPAETDVETEEDTDLPHASIAFGFPLLERSKFTLRTGVDHDPVEHPDTPAGRLACADYLGRGFPNCYDEHDGSDFILDGGFTAMDAGSAKILAAADGVVVETHDGEYDRCHASIETGDIDCDGHSGVANYVIVEHEGGIRTRYWHMATGTVAVQTGDPVTCGTILGTVGSSGYSSMPHLHFEIDDASGDAIDPYAGPRSQPETWWAEQTPTDQLPGDGCTSSAR